MNNNSTNVSYVEMIENGVSSGAHISGRAHVSAGANVSTGANDNSGAHIPAGAHVSQTLSLTSFLFGNIDDRGELEGDVFDDDVKSQLASLSRLGLGSLLRQVTDDANEDEEDEDSDDDMQEQG